MSETPKISEAKRVLLERYLRGDIPEAATVAGACREDTDAEASDSRERVVPIQIGGSKRPVFFLHGQWKLGGFFCFPIARAMGPDQPFYALEPYRFDGLSVPPTLEAIATAHLKSVRTVQPEGPYLLGGRCNGALLAYEMARQLHAEGQKVDLLVLMDPVYLVYPMSLRLVHTTIRRLGKFVGRGEDSQLAWFLWLREVYTRLWHGYSYLRFADYRRSNGFLGFEREDYPGIYHWTAMDYGPTSLYPGKITFLWSIGQPFRRGWRAVEKVNEVEIHTIPSRYEASVNEHLDYLADHFRTFVTGAIDLAAASGSDETPVPRQVATQKKAP